MTYLALARKWRPRTFADLVGQAHVVRALTNALTANRLHHAYLFSGTRGVGKTTIARIFAKALNCASGVVAEPCGECDACREIDDGRFVDLLEIDAASRTRVDDTREILDNVQYAPAHGRFKVYLIDEVHMLSSHSFNALLKTLEEPPEHVKFLLATTDPQKLPVTVLSRCLQFNLQRLPRQLIAERLSAICQHEKFEADASALELLARAANGSVRDALSLLDQAVAFGAGKVAEDDTRTILGTVDRGEITAVIEALIGGDAAELLDVSTRIDEQFPDYARLLDELASMLQRIAVWQLAGPVETADTSDVALMERAADAFAPEDVQLFYQTVLVGKRDLDLAPDVRSGFEMTLLRMLAFRPADSIDGPEQRGAGDVRMPAAKRTSTPAPAGKSRPVAAPAVATPTAPAEIPSDVDWYRLVAELELTGVERMMAGNCAWERNDGHRIILTMDEMSAAQLSEPRRRGLEAALARHFRGAVALEIRVTTDGAESPSRRDQRAADEKNASLRDAIERDPNVETIKNLFNAEVDLDSVRAIADQGQ